MLFKIHFKLLFILCAFYQVALSYPIDYNELSRNWGTYYGGNDEENGKSKGLEIDNDGCIIIAGGTKSNNISKTIASDMAFQTSLIGVRDAFIVKFNPDGTREWSTYFGGNKWDFARDICIDMNNNIYVTGFTGSTTGIATLNSHQEIHSGGDDAFITKFDRDGKRIWSTYYGGTENEHIHSIEFDGKSSIYTCGRTSSPNTNAAIATNGAYQTQLGGGADGYLAKFDTNGKRIWSTYFGAELLDACKAITFLPNGNIILVGATESKNLKVSSNAYQTKNAGKNDCFIAIFSSDGILIKSTYFGGSGEDHPQSVAINNDGLIIIVGETSSNGISKGSVHQNQIKGDLDGFISIFDENLNLLSSTYFGGNLYDNILDVFCNDLGEIVVCGSTESSNNISFHKSYQSYKNKGPDGFFAVFNKYLNLKYSTYYGGSANDLIFGIRSKSDTIAISGMTDSDSPDILCSSNAFQKLYSGSYDIFIAQFSTYDPSIVNNNQFDKDFLFRSTKDNIYWNYNNINNFSIEIYDILGRPIYITNSKIGYFDFEMLPFGFYFIKLLMNNKIMMEKFVK